MKNVIAPTALCYLLPLLGAAVDAAAEANREALDGVEVFNGVEEFLDDARGRSSASSSCFRAATTEAEKERQCTMCASSYAAKWDKASRSCVLTDATKKEIKEKMITMHAGDHPSWTVMGVCRDASNTIWFNPGAGALHKCYKTVGKVSCPCSSSSKPLDASAAQKIIGGQLAQLAANQNTRNAVAKMMNKIKNSYMEEAMTGCWKSRCNAAESLENLENSAGLDELLGSQTEATAGWDCG